MNELLFPGPTNEFNEARERYGDVSVLPTIDYLYGLQQGEEHEVEIAEGKTLILGVQAISDADERGYRTVMATINGQLRPISVRDQHVSADVAAAEKADTSKPGQVAAPFQGVVTIVGRGGRAGRRRRHRRHHRGDEDGGLDHRPRRRHGASGSRSPGRRPSRAATSCWCWAEVGACRSGRCNAGLSSLNTWLAGPSATITPRYSGAVGSSA